MSCAHMTCQTLKFHCTHEERQHVNFASSLFLLQLTTIFVQLLTSHVIVQHVVAILLSICGRFNNPIFMIFFLFVVNSNQRECVLKFKYDTCRLPKKNSYGMYSIARNHRKSYYVTSH